MSRNRDADRRTAWRSGCWGFYGSRLRALSWSTGITPGRSDLMGPRWGGEPRRGGKHTRQGGGVEALGKGGVLRKEHLLREHLWRQHGRAERR